MQLRHVQLQGTNSAASQRKSGITLVMAARLPSNPRWGALHSTCQKLNRKAASDMGRMKKGKDTAWAVPENSTAGIEENDLMNAVVMSRE